MSWIKDLVAPKERLWEEFYRNRWQHDRVVRSTHGVNCTGSCSWMVYVKEGIVVWEMQATDYPILDANIPQHEPRGCQRGISFSWYIYSPLRIKYPYIRGALLDLWRRARQEHSDPLAAWEAVMTDEAGRRSYQEARGKGGFRRIGWEEALEITVAANLSTVKRYGSDRVVGFSPIPAMSMCSYAAGSRYLSLLGGVILSFYDWYADLPPASPETWGEKTDVSESADWYNSKLIVLMGTNLNMTRTPDAHFVTEARSNGSRLVVLSPDFSQVSRHADWWLPVTAGQDGAFWMAVNHVILQEFHANRQIPYFTDYLRRYADAPFLVALEKSVDGASYTPGRFVRAASLSRYCEVENGEWKFLVFDEKSGEPRMPRGSIGSRWQKQQGEWNLEMKDGLDGEEIAPLLSLLEYRDDVLPVSFPNYAGDTVSGREVPVRYFETKQGKVAITTVFDLLMAHCGVGRGLKGGYPSGYDNAEAPYTPAWQERYTGIGRDTVIRFAREWAETAMRTGGKCTIIVGSGANHWYHSNLTYRAGITSLILCGCVGVNGGGLNHYTGQEKVHPEAAWSTLAFAHDWDAKPRLQNTPSFHYVHTDQWRYDQGMMKREDGGDDGPVGKHPMELQTDAVKMGWLPFNPQFDRSPADLVAEAELAGAKSDEEIIAWVTKALEEKRLRFAIEDPDAPENWPRVWMIWRGNALLSSAKGHEYFLKHYLGTHHNSIAEETTGVSADGIDQHEPAPRGKLDLVVDINFRMDTSALYSDLILPAATWYEKDDLNTTDLHSFIHPLSAAVPPCWEARSDWDIFKAIAEKTSELARTHFPEPFREVVATPLMHDTPDEIAQGEVKAWYRGECEAIPGRSMPRFTVVERDYLNLYERFVSIGTKLREGMTEKGIHWPVADLYDELRNQAPVREWQGEKRPSLENVVDAANAILHFAPETNGEAAWIAFQAMEQKVGLPLADLAADTRAVRHSFSDLVQQPRRVLTSPFWSGITNNGRPYAAFTQNIERLIPWRTLTGRQHLYIDHQWYLAFGEQLPIFKGKIGPNDFGGLKRSGQASKSLMLNYLTPHGKWHMHTTYYDNHRMLTLSRGMEPFWLNEQDAAEIEVTDNDWVEVHNDHGVVVTRAAVSARIPRGIGMYYHAPERTIGVPKSPLRGNKRAGGHNSLTRTQLKPLLMAGGYAQICYAFNAWGPPGSDRDTYVYVHKLEGKPRY